MRFFVFLAAAAAAIVTAAPLAQAGSSSTPVQREAKHDRDVIRFFVRHPTLAETPAGTRAFLRVIVHMDRRLRTLQSARAAQTAWPAHRLLWDCIHGGEAAWDANTGNSYYGGLQMTAGWLGYFPDTANHYTPVQQEQFAEQGYRDSGYSRSWLSGQWPNTVQPCWQYAD